MGRFFRKVDFLQLIRFFAYQLIENKNSVFKILKNNI